MAKAAKAKQLSFTMDDKVGLLLEICEALTEAQVNILSVCAYEMDGKATFYLATDGNAKAKKAIAKFGTEIKEENVITVEIQNKVGELRKVTQILADANISIKEIYGTAGSGKTSVAVLKTANDTKALKLING